MSEPIDFWPEPFFDAAVETFGPCMYAYDGRMRKQLDQRVQHAYRVWRTKYGSLNPAQEAYACDVLLHALRHGVKAAKELEARPAPLVYTSITKIINHERVHAGFKSRAEGRDRSRELAEMGVA